MQEFIRTVVEWVVAVDPATLKWSAAVLLAAFFGLVLFGLFQYQAFNRDWGLHLVLGLAGGAFVAGLGGSLHWTLGVLYAVGYLLTWLVWVLTRRLSGWRQHLLRGLAAAVCLGPWLWVGATECRVMGRGQWSLMAPAEGAAWLVAGAGSSTVFMLPGLLWPAILVAGGSWWAAGRPGFGGAPRGRRFVMVAWVIMCLLGLNWHVAGRFDMLNASREGRRWTVGYVVFSQPGRVAQRLLDGLTLLHRAAMRGDVAMIRVLLAAGAEVDARDGREWTPLHGAAYNGRAEVTSLLLAAGAQINARTEHGETPLSWAAYRGEIEVVRLLLAAGADANARKKGRWTPLHDAAWNGHTDIVRSLLAAGADVHAQGGAGETPLHGAVYATHDESVRLLLAAGAAVNTRQREGATAMDRAMIRTFTGERETRRRAVVAMLRAAGAKTGAELDAAAPKPAEAPATVEGR